jgi:hypothetical protein
MLHFQSKKEKTEKRPSMTNAQTEIITLDQALAEARGKGRTVGELHARYEQSLQEAEAECGPQVPSLMLHLLPKRGRPKMGEPIKPAKSKSIRMSPVFWDELQRLAVMEGLSLHTAMRAALLEWVGKRHA